MAFGPLPAASIDRFSAGWPDEDVEAFHLAMRRMDAVYHGQRKQKPTNEDPLAAFNRMFG